jgi:hypothetical protein
LSRLRLLYNAVDVDEIVGDDAEADPALHSGRSLVAATAEAVSPFDDAGTPLASGTPLLAITEPTLFLLAFAFKTFGGRLGTLTRLTPFAFAAASFRAE